jgi:hypothetical protein
MSSIVGSTRWSRLKKPRERLVSQDGLPKTTLYDFGQARTLLFLWARTDIICREEPEKRSGAWNYREPLQL